jgi:hypothetical protein
MVQRFKIGMSGGKQTLTNRKGKAITLVRE